MKIDQSIGDVTRKRTSSQNKKEPKVGEGEGKKRNKMSTMFIVMHAWLGGGGGGGIELRKKYIRSVVFCNDRLA